MKLFKPKSFNCASDGGYIAVYHIEKSIADLAPRLGGVLLDVGCGAQPYRHHYFGHVQRYIGCDYDGGRGPVEFTCPADKVPLNDASVDSILCTEVLEHVPDPMKVWKEFYRLLKPGGQVLLSTPMYWPPHELPYDFYRYPEHGLRYLAEESGFEILEIKHRGGPWSFWGQVTMHVHQRYFVFGWMRKFWNLLMLKLDQYAKRRHPTLGWTVLARKLDVI